MPGSNPRALEKARSLPADALILDLEDAVLPEAKADARAKVCAAVTGGGYGARELIVRVNGLATPWAADDIEACAAAGPDAILVPKVETASELHDAALMLEKARAPERTALWVMMETPRAMLRAQEIADAHPRLACFVMGTSDLVKDINALHTPMRLPVLASLSLCVLAARAAGLAILDGVHLDLGDEAGFAQACRQGRELGFDGKTLIHPKQIAAANDAFGPTPAEVEHARRVIAAHGAAEAQGKGVVLLDGQLIENLHVEAAHRTVAVAEAIAAMGGA